MHDLCRVGGKITYILFHIWVYTNISSVGPILYLWCLHVCEYAQDSQESCYQGIWNVMTKKENTKYPDKWVGVLSKYVNISLYSRQQKKQIGNDNADLIMPEASPIIIVAQL